MPTLDHLVQQGHDVVAVLTQPDAPVGRGRRLTPSPVAARAEELGLTVLRPERAGEVQAELAALAPELGVVVAYGQILRQPMLDVPAHGWMNLHFSLLPRWRGAAPVQRAIMAGDTQTGSTVFRLVPALDAGPVWATSSTTIGARETAGELLDRMARDGAALVSEAIDVVASGAEPAPQEEAGETHAAKLGADDGRLDLTRAAADLDRQVRGCTPAPGAWTTFRGERFKVLAALPVEAELAPGALQVGKNEVLLGTGHGALRLDRVQPPGKKPMGGADWARGVTLADGEGLGA